jgi:hypothetical protein
VEITCRLKTPVPGIERVRTVRPLASRPMRKPRNPHENPRPLFDAFSRKPSGKRADFRNRQAKFMHSRILETNSVAVYVEFPQPGPWTLGGTGVELKTYAFVLQKRNADGGLIIEQREHHSKS